MKKMACVIAGLFAASMAGAVQIETASLPGGDVGLPYSATMSATNGTPPFLWSWYGGIGSYQESTELNSYSGVGVPQGWSADEGEWSLALPFEFPLFHESYTNCRVDSNGQIWFGGDHNARIAVMSDDLDTSSGDIYVDSTPTAVTIRWEGNYWWNGAESVACSATLARNGTITLKYGVGNAYGGYIALESAFAHQISPYTWSGSMNYASDIVFSPDVVMSNNIAGLVLSPSGTVSGTPTQTYSNLVAIAVVDDTGDFDARWCRLVIYDDRDYDGMLDQWERLIVDHNPLDSIVAIEDVLRDDDYDGDGFLNIEEFLLGYDPVVADTDPLDTMDEGLSLVAAVFTNEFDVAYLSLIDSCFANVVSAEPTNYAARVYRAAARMFNLAGSDDLHGLLGQFGATLDFDFSLSGDFDLLNAPFPDTAVDVVCSNLLPAIDASYDDLTVIPSNWNGMAEFSTNYFPMDETVYADIGDVTVARAALKGLRSIAMIMKAQSLNGSYEKLIMPTDAPVAAISVDGDTNDWAGVPVQLMGDYSSGIEYVKSARSTSSVYLLVCLRDTGKIPAGLGASLYLAPDSYMEVEGYPIWGFTSVWFEASNTYTEETIVSYTNSCVEIEVPVPPGIAIANASIEDVWVDYAENMGGYWYWVGSEEVFVPENTPIETMKQNHPDFMETVRDETAIAEALINLQEAIDMGHAADGLIQARSDALMHFIEYDPSNAMDRVEFFARMGEVEQSLSVPVQLVFTNEFGEVELDETVHIGAFFEPTYLSRAMLPDFWKITGQPMLDTVPDPTFGGIFPSLSQEKLNAYFWNNGPDNPIDWDGDGLLNGWEITYGGNPTNMMAWDDDDHDGWINLFEAYTGTDPTNAASLFSAEFEADDPLHLVIRWQAAQGRVYDVEQCSALDQGYHLMETGIAYPQNAYTVTVQQASSSGFYRVVARIPSPDDIDADGLPDLWEGQHFGNFSADAKSDDDNDHQINIHEYIAGTNPMDKDSYFHASGLQAVPSGIVVEWLSVPDRVYGVKWASEVGGEFQLLEGDLAYPQGSFTDTAHGAESTGFYTLDVRMQ